MRGHCWATPSRVRVATHPSCFGSPVRVLGDSCDGDGEVDESSCDTAQEVLGRGGRGHCPGLPGVEHSFGIWSRAGSPDRGMGSEGHQVAGTGLEPTVPRGQWALQAALTHLVPCRSGTPGAPALSWPHLALPSSPPPLPFLPLPRCPWRLPAAGLPRSGSSWPSPAQWTTGRGPACSLPCGWAHKHISLFDEKDVGNLVTCFLLALQWGDLALGLAVPHTCGRYIYLSWFLLTCSQNGDTGCSPSGNTLDMKPRNQGSLAALLSLLKQQSLRWGSGASWVTRQAARWLGSG